MPDISRYGHSTNLIGIATHCLASQVFNENPLPLHIAGTRESASGLFEYLNKQTSRLDCGRIFQDYMYDVFGCEADPALPAGRSGPHRYRNSYLRLIQDWGLDSNNAQGAVFKGWVESRFGLFPSYHKQRLTGFNNVYWTSYIAEKMHSRYHNNCIYMQLDLLYEFCQWFIEHFHYPAARHKTLFRGVNSLAEDDIIQAAGPDKVLRFNSLVSFTDRPSIASEFGSYILAVEVPMVKLVFFNDLLPHHALRGESEYLVIGGDYRVKVLL